MTGVDPRAVEVARGTAMAARRAADQARRAGELAGRAADQAQRAAELRERMSPDAPAALVQLRAQTAAFNRQNEICQRNAARLLSTFARRLEYWIARRDASRFERRPLLMSEAAQAAGWGGAVLTLRDGAGADMFVAASDVKARRVHELEVALAEGPSMEASEGRMSIAYRAELETRWPRFGKAASDLGVQAVAAVPLDTVPDHTAASSLSAIGPPMPAGRGDLGGLLAVAGALDMGVLRSSKPVGGTDTEVPILEMFESDDFQPALHQAAGVLSGRHGWDVSGAVALIRAHAFAENRSVSSVAEDIVAGRLWAT